MKPGILFLRRMGYPAQKMMKTAEPEEPKQPPEQPEQPEQPRQILPVKCWRGERGSLWIEYESGHAWQYAETESGLEWF